MDPELQALLDQINGIAELGDDDVVQLETDLVAAFTEARVDSPTQEQLTTMIALRDAVTAARTARVEREDAAEARAAEAAAIVAQVEGLVTDETEPTEAPDPEAPAEEPAPEAPAEEAPTAPAPEAAPAAAPAVEVEVNAPQAEVEILEETESEPERVLVTAAAPAPVARPARPTISRLAERRPQALAPRRETARPPQTIIAGGDIPDISAGGHFRDLDHVAASLERRWMDIRGAEGHGEHVRVAQIQGDYPEERRLDMAMNPEQVMERIDAVSGRDAVVAAGGLCAPVEPYYGLANISDARRPVRDSLAQFQATRGGITFITPPHLTDLAGSVGVWTVATDATPGGATKARITVACGTPTTVTTDAITSRVKFGNFGARTFPEQVRTWMDLALAAHARVAETRLLTQIGTLSKKVTTGQELGAARDILVTFDKAGSAIRSRHRTVDDMPLRAILPLWAQDLIRADLARQLPGDSSNAMDRLAQSDEYINTFFTARDINITWTPDGEPGQIIADQTDNSPLLGFPVHAIGYLFPEGSFTFLDGGTLDLGLVRDSTLNSTNDFEMFSETFENVAFTGIESLRIDMKVCADGSTSGARAITPCGSQAGS